MTGRICPKCNGVLKLDDIYDITDHNDLCVGHCSSCGTQYQWQENYEFIGVTDIKEVD